MQPMQAVAIPGSDGSLSAQGLESSAEGGQAGAVNLDAETRIAVDANAQRLSILEKELLQMQAHLIDNQAHIRTLQTQLLEAQNAPVPVWIWAALGLLAAALATIAWLLRRIHQMLGRNAGSALPSAPDQLADKNKATQIQDPSIFVSELPRATFPSSAFADAVPTPRDGEWAQVQPDDVIAPSPEPAVVPEAPALATDPSLAELTEVLTSQALFDVREQAEFYASIGENDQAIAILQTHIAQNQASSPLAYLELLQLLYRLGRAEAFEQMREQFHQHFNVQAPSFMGFARKGHDLWSAHPEVLGEIEALWPSDEVINLLRSLIVYRPSQALPRFDLAAFEDLLMLYGLAKATPAQERGQLQGRLRTTPLEAPLPEMVLDMPPAPELPQFPSFLGQTATAEDIPSDTPVTQAPLLLQEAALEMLSVAPAQAPLASEAARQDSPFQGPSHFAPNEVLVEGLSLDWTEAALPAAHNPAAAKALAASEDEVASLDDMLDLLKTDPANKANADTPEKN